MKEKEIKQTIGQGQILYTPYVRIHFNRPPNASPATQFACVVSKKISPSAVRRHKYQRWLREVMRPLVPSLPSGTRLVLIARPTISNLKTLSSLRDSLVSLLNKHLRAT